MSSDNVGLATHIVVGPVNHVETLSVRSKYNLFIIVLGRQHCPGDRVCPKQLQA